MLRIFLSALFMLITLSACSSQTVPSDAPDIHSVQQSNVDANQERLQNSLKF